ncbi:hypothetical protein Pcinc_006897 [Petrolisthes cinctipes]|uniref:Pentraxin (PTX) domain-containing protein n=1 Tax=Petrolisthes cinctipes TaxID=88211 RepID=A0AAE1GBY2_PETCI|nr:hypothetical protein Pcinc_006897 [Petrolisthes cinctipes]
MKFQDFLWMSGLLAVTPSYSITVYHLRTNGKADSVTCLKLPNLNLLLAHLHSKGCVPDVCSSPSHSSVGTTAVGDVGDGDTNVVVGGATEGTARCHKNQTSSYLADLNISPPPSAGITSCTLENFTICFWFKADYFMEDTAFFSYAVSDSNSNVIIVGVWMGYIYLHYQYKRLTTTPNEAVQPYRWYHMCLRLDAGRLSLHLDGNNNILKDRNEGAPSPPLPLNGTLVIGNDQDSLGGGFADTHSYLGAVSGFTIWDQSLSQQQMVDLFNWSQHQVEHLNQEKSQENDSARNLTLSSCQPGYFTCLSGSCIPLDQRCSLVSECTDHSLSDELDCVMVRVPVGYQKLLSPASPTLHLGLSLKLHMITSVDLMNMIVKLSFTVKLRWRDYRLTFTNLHDNPQFNGLSLTPESDVSVWLPVIRLLNESRLAGTVPPLTKLQALKSTTGIDIGTGEEFRLLIFDINAPLTFKPVTIFSRCSDKPDIIILHALNRLPVPRTETTLEYVLSYESNLLCFFYLDYYPFDSQTCSINLSVTNAPNELITYHYLESATTNQLSQLNSLAEFYVDGLQLSLKNGSRNIWAAFHLFRRPAYHLFSTYLPTVLLHSIGFFTLSIPPQNFQDRGTMSLTTMLVLVSLYTELQSGLPKTAYLKLIDFWFICSICFLTSIIMVHLATSNTTNSSMISVGDGNTIK